MEHKADVVYHTSHNGAHVTTSEAYPGVPHTELGQAAPGYPPVQQEYGQKPVLSQPGGMSSNSDGSQNVVMQGDPNIPPGLEYLTMVDQLLVKQKVELLEAFTGFETANEYEVFNTMGQHIYTAKEDDCCCCCPCCFVCCKPCVRCWKGCQTKCMCCCKERPWTLGIYDHARRRVMEMDRPLRCSSCWYPCCLQKVTVYAYPGNVIGYVKQDWSLCKPYYTIKDERDHAVLRIQGPCVTYSCCCGDVNFKVLSVNGDQEVGRVAKQWGGLAKEKFTDADNFGISFPIDLDVKVKATVLAACFLIDYMFFEDSPGSDKDKPGMAD